MVGFAEMKTPGPGSFGFLPPEITSLSNDLNASFWVVTFSQLRGTWWFPFIISNCACKNTNALGRAWWGGAGAWGYSWLARRSLSDRCSRVNSGDTQHEFYKGRQRIWVFPQLHGQHIADD